MKEVDQYLTGKALTGKKLKSVKAIVIHWFADPMAKATNVIKYWQSQANGISAHDVICLDGTVYHAVPYDAMAYQVGCPRGYTKEALQRLSAYPNDCVVGIECAHLDNKGTMTKETYASLVELSARLLKKFNLTINDLWLHSEIVGKDYKDCHRWFTTTQPSDWPKFKNEVDAVLNPVPADSADGKLVRGEKGPNVQVLNQWLHELGYTFKTDDLFDQYTEAALLVFQKEHGLPQDAVYTSAIGDMIQKAIADKKAFQSSAVIDVIPDKAPGKYRLAKFVDTDDPKLIDQYKKDGFKIIALP